MTPEEINKINRFKDRIPDHLAEHWNEIIEIIEPFIRFEDVISETELSSYALTMKLRNAYKNISILELWVQEGKINTRRGFLNYIGFMKDKIKEGINV